MKMPECVTTDYFGDHPKILYYLLLFYLSLTLTPNFNLIPNHEPQTKT